MRMHSKRALSLVGALTVAVGLTACGGEPASDSEETASTDAGSTTAATEEAEETASEEATPAAEDPDSTAVESIDEMPPRLMEKYYSCRDWKRTDDIEGADASGTCNGEDQIMWFASEDAVEAKRAELDEQGMGYVHGDNWIVANTKTPTMVRNAFGGEAVPAKG